MGFGRVGRIRDAYLAQEYEPIRISMDYDNMDNCTEDQKEYLITRVFVPLRDKLQTLIKVKQSGDGVTLTNAELCVETPLTEDNREAPDADLKVFVTCISKPNWNVA